MGNIIFSLTLAVLSLQFFSTSYCLIGLNRVMMNIPISIFETSIPLVQNVDDPIIYYNQEVLEDKLTHYFEKSVTKYCDRYFLSYYYYNQDNHAFCLSEQCDAVEITLFAKVMGITEYTKSVRFYIQDNR